MKKILVLLSFLFLLACNNVSKQEVHFSKLNVIDMEILTLNSQINLDILRQNLSSKLSEFIIENTSSNLDENASVIVSSDLNTKNDFYEFIYSELSNKGIQLEESKKSLDMLFSNILFDTLKEDILKTLKTKDEYRDIVEEELIVFIITNENLDKHQIIIAFNNEKI